MYAKNTNVKLTNFHCACYGRERPSSARGASHPYYRSLQAEEGWLPQFSNDIWSMGCVMFEMYDGRTFYEVSGLNNTSGRTRRNAYRLALSFFHHVFELDFLFNLFRF